MAQSGPGKIRLFNDFFGVENVLALTGDPALGAGAQLGEFILGGEGIEDADAGIVGKDALSGVVTLTVGDVNTDTAFIGTHIGFDVGLMGTIVLETRVQMGAITAREVFFGLTSILTLDEQLEDIVINATATTITMPADLVGFYLSDELTTVAGDWHAINNGGTASATTTTTGDAQLNDPVATGEWQVLRLEVDANGTARWYIDGVLKRTATGAASTTTDVAMCLAVGANAGTVAAIDVDYILVEANRDWTV